MPAVALPVIGAIGGAFGIGAPLTAIPWLATATGAQMAGGMALGTVLKQLAVGVAMTALSRAIGPKAPTARAAGGMKLQPSAGEEQPLSFGLGRYATAGDLVFHGSYTSGTGSDKSNAKYAQVFALSDVPVTRLRRVFINGEWAELGDEDPLLGREVLGYRVKRKARLWVRFYDGNQTTADPGLLAAFPVPHVQPWDASMVGRGCAYAIVTADYRTEVHSQRPTTLFELDGIRLYDPRRDSTAGGSGPQRLADPSTWAFSGNLIVQVYNILLGIRDPLTGRFLWGGQGINAADLTRSEWFAAMNEADLRVDGRPQYHGGLEARADEEPAAVIEELLKGAQGDIAEVAGTWTVRAGPPGLPVYAFSDADIIVTEPEETTPFAGLDEAYNGVRASYPDPDSGWQSRDAPPRDRADYLAADGGRANIASLTFGAVHDPDQVQQLMKAALDGARRFRRHAFVLPPEARCLGPLDVVARTSSAHGYDAKSFDLIGVEDLQNGNAALVMREVDPSDYDFGPGDLLPIDPGFVTRPPRPVLPVDFSVEPAALYDASGAARRAAIRLNWTPTDGADAIRFRVRLAATQEHVPLNGQVSIPEGEESAGVLTLNGQAATLNGETVTYSQFTDVEDGTALISGEGILPATGYQVQPWYWPNGKPGAWLPVTTPDIRLGEVDFEQEVRDRINQAAEDAAIAKGQAKEAQDRAEEAIELTSSLADGAVQDLLDAVAALNALDPSTLAEGREIALAGLRRGWVSDPAFYRWAAGRPSRWTVTGQTSQMNRGGPAATYGSSIHALVPAGTGAFQLRAASDVADQMPGADPSVEYVAVSILFYARSGSLGSGRLRAEWRIGGDWVRGRAWDTNQALGELASQWGGKVSPTVRQSLTAVWRKPAGEATAVSLFFQGKNASFATGLDIEIEHLDIRPATEAEIEATLAGAYTDAAISSLSTLILGPTGALVGVQTELNARFGADFTGTVQEALVAEASSRQALAGRITSLEAVSGDGNLIRNPDFADGQRAPGVRPDRWLSWPETFEVVGRGSSAATAVQTAPTRFMARLPLSTATQAGTCYLGEAQQGDYFSLRLRYATAGSAPREANIGFQFMWEDAEGGVIGSSGGRGPGAAGQTAWLEYRGEIGPAPAGTARLRLRLRRIGGGSGDAYVAQLDARRLDVTVRARIDETAVVAANADAAVASITEKVAASFGNWDAFVEETATAVATAEQAASTYVVRAVAGGGFAGLRLVAWDDENGTDGAVFLDARNVLAPGTVTAGEIVVTDLGFNLVPDNMLKSRTVWSGEGFQVIADTSAEDANSEGEIRWANPGGQTGWRSCSGKNFAVRPGQRLTCEFQVAKGGSGVYTARAQLFFYRQDGSYIDGSARVIDVVTGGGNTTLSTRSGVITVPTGARKARWVWQVDASATTAGSVRFWGPEAIRRTNGSALITPDGAFFAMLSAEEAWIGEANIANLSVGTLKLKSGSIGRRFAGTREADFGVGIGGEDVLTINIPSNMLPAGATSVALISVSSHYRGSTVAATSTVYFQCLVDGVAVFFEGYEYRNGNGTDSMSVTFGVPVENGDAITWRISHAAAAGAGMHYKTTINILNVFQVN